VTGAQADVAGSISTQHLRDSASRKVKTGFPAVQLVE